MTGSLLIDGMMAFFSLVLLGAILVPTYLVLPRRMERERARRVAFHTGAIFAIDTELARPQADVLQVARLEVQRQRNIAALMSLEPATQIPPPPVVATTYLGVAA
jgi:hypothetical protein